MEFFNWIKSIFKATYRLKSKVDTKGDTYYYTTKNGWFIVGSVALNLDAATKIYNDIVDNANKSKGSITIKKHII